MNKEKFLVKHENIQGFDEWTLSEDAEGNRIGTLTHAKSVTRVELDGNSNLKVYVDGEPKGEIREGYVWDVVTFILIANEHSPLLGEAHVIKGEAKKIYG